MTTVNLQALMQQAAQSGGNVPAGTYDCVVHACKFQTSKTNKPQWVFTFKVLSGQFAGAEIRDWQTVSAESSGALNVLFARLAVLGIDSSWIMSNPGDLPGDHIAQLVTGRTVRLIVEQDGQYLDVKRYEQVPAGVVATPAAGMQQPAAAPQGFQPPGMPQQSQGFQPAPQQPQPQFQQPAAAAPAPQPGFQPQPQQPYGQPAQPQGQPAGFGGQMEPQNVTQMPGYQQAGGPMPQQQPPQVPADGQPAYYNPNAVPADGQPLPQQPQQYQAPTAPPPQRPWS